MISHARCITRTMAGSRSIRCLRYMSGTAAIIPRTSRAFVNETVGDDHHQLERVQRSRLTLQILRRLLREGGTHLRRIYAERESGGTRAGAGGGGGERADGGGAERESVHDHAEREAGAASRSSRASR